MRVLSIAIAMAASFLASSSWATDLQGRIDIQGYGNGIVLTPGSAEGGSIMNATWEKDQLRGKQTIVTFFNADSDWRKGVFSFTPDKDGQVSLLLKGAWDKDGVITWTIIDAVQLEGAEIKNGNFEDGAANWIFPEKGGQKASISDIAKSGSKSVKVAHECPAIQMITVKAGQPVTVKFWYKAAE